MINPNGPEISVDNDDLTASHLIPLWMAWLPVVALIAMLAVNVGFYADDATFGANQVALLLAATIAAVVGLTLKVKIHTMIEGIKESLHSSLTALLILLLIGALVGTWVISGIVPALIYYGLQILDARIFLAASVIVCAIVSLATGSSWSTIGTVGVALMGIGQALGISPAITAGAIISGAYFGDKISPLSDTTNLAAAMAGTELITHIRYLMYTTVPSITITLIVFLAIGFTATETVSVAQSEALQNNLAQRFNLTPLLFIVPVCVLVLVAFKVDAIAALMVGTLLGGVFAVIFQPAVIRNVSEIEQTESRDDDWFNYAQASYVAVVNAMAFKVEAIPESETTKWSDDLAAAKTAAEQGQTGLEEEIFQLESKLAAAKLTSGKGMNEMLSTIWLIICAMCFGGVMEACGLLRRITSALLSMANSLGSLVATTAGSCIFLNLTASDQYLAIVVPGRMFRESFRERGFAPENLSRTLEDSGTVTSVLIPWNTCGAAQRGVLGVDPFHYAIYCFFNWISPLMTLAFAFLQIKIARLKPE